MLTTAILFSVLVNHISGFCPSGCECDDMGINVGCLGAGITVVPILLNPSLRRLNLSFNTIRDIEQAFDFYEWMQNLDLAHNRISNLGRRNFEQQLEVEELKLHHNNITTIYQDSFKGLRSLLFVDISHNNLKHVPDNFLAGSPRLRILILSHNNIGSVSAKGFAGLSSLKILKLNGNLLVRIPGASFLFVRNTIEVVDLGDNHIPGVQPDDFPTPSLRSVSLQKNKIKFIHPDGFVYLKKLKSLNLQENLLERVPSRAFGHIINLATLRFSQNNITVIGSTCLRALQKLTKLDISRNFNLRSLSSSSFSSSSRLKTLIMSYNPHLTSLPKGLLTNLPRIMTIDLKESGLESLARADLPWKTLISLDLRGNPLVCNCSLSWLKEIVLLHNNSITAPDVLCWRPMKLRGIFLSRIPNSSLSCLLTMHIVSFSLCASIACVLLATIIIFLIRDRFQKWNSYRSEKLLKL